MKGEALDCAQIRRVFLDGRVPEGPAVAAHLPGCAACRELFQKDAALGRQLALAALPAVPVDELFESLEAELGREVGLRAWLRALPSWLRAGALMAVALGLLAWHLVSRRRADFAEYSAVVFWGIAAVLGVALGLGAWRLARGASAPLRSLGSERALALSLLLLPALAALLLPLGAPAASAGPALEATLPLWGGGVCFTYGAALVAPFAALAWLLERRDRVPGLALVSAGALAGIAANLLLQAHCTSEHLGHLLLGHASIGVAWALGLGLLSAGLRRG